MIISSAKAKHSPRAAHKRVPRRSLARFVRLLQAQLPKLTAQYHIRSLGVFGSYARREEKRSSDLDLVAEFTDSLGLSQRDDLARDLSKSLRVKVEVIPKESLPPYIRKSVMREVLWLQKDGVAQAVKLPRKPRRPNGKHNGANMEPKREYLDYIQDMLDNMARVQRFVAGITVEEMIADDKTDFAVRYALQVIDEAANRIPTDIRQIYPQIPWRQIIDFRNAMAHGYDRMMYGKVWETIHQDIPRDQPLIAVMLEAEKKRRGVDESEMENGE
jgi:uncharacterized protein with HEPN domain/predicted nucleotidyltransferase